MGADCKSAGVFLRRFESYTCHHARTAPDLLRSGQGLTHACPVSNDGNRLAAGRYAGKPVDLPEWDSSQGRLDAAGGHPWLTIGRGAAF
jgi:hypothetical protein